MDVRDLATLRAQLLDRLANRAERRTPSEHHQVAAICVAEDLEGRNFPCDSRDLARPRPHHQLVIGRRVTHVAGLVLARETADTMLEAGCSRHRPRARKRLGVAQIREEALGIRTELNL